MAAQSMMVVAGDVDGNDDVGDNKPQSQECFPADANCTLSTSGQPTNFMKHFSTSNGPPQVLFICFMLALASGCTVGVVRSDNCSVVKSSILLSSFIAVSLFYSFSDTSSDDRQIRKEKPSLRRCGLLYVF
jgi:hypothetical protein